MRELVIAPLHQASMEACRLRIDNLTKPIYSLAHLELIAERMAGITGNPKPNHLHYGILVVGADHLVDGPKNSQHGRDSYAVMKRFNEGRTATQGAAFKLNATVHVVDVGLERSTTELSFIEQEKIASGSHFFGVKPAMSRDELERALELGFHYADRLHDEGLQVIAMGNVGARSFLDALVTTATITGNSYESLLTETDCGPTIAQRGAYIKSFTDQYDLSTTMNLLQVAGGYDIATLTGFILGAASHRMAVVFDNAVTGAAVLAAISINDQVKDYIFPSAVYNEPIHQAQCEYLGLKPYLHYDLEIDEGVGATMGLSIIDAAMYMLNDMKTFVEAKVIAAEDGPGNERQENGPAK